MSSLLISLLNSPYRALVLCAFLAAPLSASLQASSQASSVSADWASYGGDPGSHKYTPLDQINESNVKSLRVAWSWNSPDNELVANDPSLTSWGFKSSPLMIDGVLYISTSLNQVAAIEASTGNQLWVFDTKTWKGGRPPNLGFNHRGVGYWSDGSVARILMPTNRGYLWSLDAATGKPDPKFGENGVVDLTLGLGRVINRRLYSVISAPMIIKDVVVVGSSISDGPRQKEMPPGHVRGFDVRTGEQRWMFHTIPQGDEFGADTWENDAWAYSGNTNVWTVMSADPELGYVYLPTGTPTNDWYAGHRLGDNLFAESLICVDAQTGERVWHFQMVHHGLWDYDLPAAPNLVDIVVDGKPIKAVAQVSKQAHIYVFDRVTGKPVWPIEEKPVRQSNVPGERSSPTQPIPSRPEPFDLQGISDDTLIDFTPELRAAAQKILEPYDYGPLFTPPSLNGTVNLPGWGGGANWSGAAVDPETGIIYIPSSSGPMVVQLRKADPEKSNFDYVRSGGISRIRGPAGLPLTKPPYARITAIDLNTGNHVWMVPHGEGIRQQIIDMGIPDPGPVGARGSSGPVLTKSLLFIAQGGRQKSFLRAFDKSTGAVVHEMELPGVPYGTPISYMDNGKQYISLTIVEGTQAKLIGLSLEMADGDKNR